MISAKTTLLGLAAAGLLALLFVHCPCRKTLASTAPMAAGALGKTATDIKWTTCDGKGDFADIKTVEIGGSFTANSQIKIRLAGTWKQSTHMESAEASVKLGFITVFEETISYPLDAKVGEDFDHTLEIALYIDAPSGSYKSTIRFKDQTGNVLQCALTTFRLG